MSYPLYGRQPEWDEELLQEEDHRSRLAKRQYEAELLAHPACDDPAHPGCDKCAPKGEE